MSLNCVHAGGKPVRDLTHEDTFFVTFVFISSVQLIVLMKQIITVKNWN